MLQFVSSPRRWDWTVGLALLTAFLWTPAATAHRLEAEAHARPFGLVQVESWYETGDAPRAARVEVFAADGRRLAEGAMENGVWTTAVPGTTALRVVVNAGGGHRAESTVSAAERDRCSTVTDAMRKWLVCAPPQPSPFVAAALLVPVEVAAPPPSPVSFPEQRGGVQWGKLSLGVGLLLGVAVAFEFRRRSRNAGSLRA